MTYPWREHFHKMAQETGFLHIIKRVIALRIPFAPLCRLTVNGIVRTTLGPLRVFKLVRGRYSGGSKDPWGTRGGNCRMRRSMIIRARAIL